MKYLETYKAKSKPPKFKIGDQVIVNPLDVTELDEDDKSIWSDELYSIQNVYFNDNNYEYEITDQTPGFYVVVEKQLRKPTKIELATKKYNI